MQRQLSGIKRGCLKKTLLFLLSTIYGLLIIFSVSNLILTSASNNEILSEEEKAQLVEVFNLRQEIGDSIWVGWSSANIPVILYNEKYAFLIGIMNPEKGWHQIPGDLEQGDKWEQVPNDLINGNKYYRQKLSNSEVNPQAFIVKVGNRWVASMSTKSWMLIKMGNEIRDGLPPILNIVIPYRIMAIIFQSFTISTDSYICSIAHESFHAFQAISDSARLFESEKYFNEYGKMYPWNDEIQKKYWDQELNILADALSSKNDQRLMELTRKFISIREKRRSLGNLSTAQVMLEKKREWEEGLAKYTELAVWKFAAKETNHKINFGLNNDSDFFNYKKFKTQWFQEMATLRYQAEGDETKFYYSGMAQAFLLDKLSPGWKLKIILKDVYLEDLVTKIVNNNIKN